MGQVGRRIAELRAARRLTQEAVAATLGVSLKYYQRVEWGRENVTLESLARIAAALRLPPSSLLEPPRDSASRRGRPRRAQSRQPIGASAAFRVTEAPARGAVPLLSLPAAAGFRGPTAYAEAAAWVVPVTRRRLREGMFVAQVVGTSMEPMIPNGAFCLFEQAGLTDDGGVYLVALREALDPEAGRYVVKRLERVRARGRRRLRLRSVDPSVPVVELDVGSEDDAAVRVVAKLVEVLGG